MGSVNRSIVVAVVGITAIGIVRAWSSGQGITRVVIGGYLLMVFLSVADMFGGALSQIAGMIALLALVTAILTEGLPILQGAGQLAQTGKAGGAATGGGGSGGGF